MATPSLNQRILDRSVVHATFLRRMQQGEANRIIKLLEESVHHPLMDRLASRLERIKTRGFDTGPRTTKRIQNMLRRNAEIIRVGMADVYPELRSRLQQIGLSEVDFQQLLVRDSVAKTAPSLKIAVELERPAAGLLRSVVTARPMQGRLLREWWQGIDIGTRKGVNGAIQMGLAQGQTTQEITRGVRSALNTTTRNAESITRTAVNHTATHAREQLYKENDDLIEYVRYIATLDFRTTDICASLDAKEFRVGEGPRPPMHMSCRSNTSPVVKPFSELFPGLKDLPPRQRASLRGPTTGKETYGTWLRRQTPDEQARVLGVGRAKLFRDGKVPIDRFVDSQYRPLTLEQVLEREGLTRAALK